MEGGGWYDWYVGPSWQIIRVWSVWHQQVWSHKELKDGGAAEALIVRMPQKTRQKVKSHVFMIKPAVHSCLLCIISSILIITVWPPKCISIVCLISDAAKQTAHQ